MIRSASDDVASHVYSSDIDTSRTARDCLFDGNRIVSSYREIFPQKATVRLDGNGEETYVPKLSYTYYLLNFV